MKKFISFALLLALCLSLFAGCTETVSPELEAAKEYLYTCYKDNAEVTSSSFTMMGAVMIDGVSYPITWTVDNEKISITKNDDGMVTIGLPSSNLAEFSYTLTATISDDKGKSVTQTFTFSVPKMAGLEDGTYVIIANGLSFSALAEDKKYGYPTGNAVTVDGNTVTGHTAADIMTITNVDGGFTLQDCYGRYFYMSGSYDSPNVSATLPEEGHVWKLMLDDNDNILLVNVAKGKTLAYSSQYSSWGAYADSKLSENHFTALTIVAATAPEGGNTTPSEPSEPSEPSTPSEPSEPSTPSEPAKPTTDYVTNPVAGTAYKMALIHGGKDNAKMFFTGNEKENYPWYIMGSMTESDAVTVYLEEVTGGLRLYFMKNGTKTYLDMHKDGTHYSLRLTTEPTAVYTWDETNHTLIATVDDKVCFVGTSNKYDTFSCNKMDYISSSYPARFYN